MARNARRHLDEGQYGDGMVQRHLTKLEFARRLNRLMLERGWNQSELARQAGLGRDAVSIYIRGRSYPEPRNLQALATALGVKPSDLLPNAVEAAIEHDAPSLEIREAAGHSGQVWMRVNRLVDMSVALQVMQLLTEYENRKH